MTNVQMGETSLSNISSYSCPIMVKTTWDFHERKLTRSSLITREEDKELENGFQIEEGGFEDGEDMSTAITLPVDDVGPEAGIDDYIGGD
uniref:Uncharacterized protein n=1 Tax=Cannabis sativa TaxID=3483 RepID=A0A803PDS9_CANSA